MDIVAEHDVEKGEKCKLKMASFAMSWVVVVFVGSIAKIEACLSKKKWSAILRNWRKLTILITALLLSSASTTKYLTECVAKEKGYGIPFLIIIAAAQCIVNFVDLTDSKRKHCRGCNCDLMEQGEVDAVESNTSVSYIGPPNASSSPPPSSTLANQAVVPSQNQWEPAPGAQSSRSPGSLSRHPQESLVGPSTAVRTQPQPLQAAVIQGEVDAVESNPSVSYIGSPHARSLPPTCSSLATRAIISSQYKLKSSESPDLHDLDIPESLLGASAAIVTRP